MTILVVGCGYLGTRVAARLVARGDRVIGTTRSSDRAARLAAIGVEPFRFDLSDPDSAWPPRTDRVVHTVGAKPELLDGLARLVAGTDRFVHVSSTSVYGQTGVVVTEDHPTEPRTDSGRACLAAEDVVRPEGGIVVRPAGLYGPGRIIRSASIVAGEIIEADPDGLVNLIQIEDAATVCLAALDRGERGQVYNAADDRAVTRSELYGLTARCLGASAPRFTRPDRPDPPNKRVSNRRIKSELAVSLAYPDIATGLPASIRAKVW